MNMKMCATSDVAKAWNSIDWNKANAYVKKLQMRIVKAHKPFVIALSVRFRILHNGQSVFDADGVT